MTPPSQGKKIIAVWMHTGMRSTKEMKHHDYTCHSNTAFFTTSHEQTGPGVQLSKKNINNWEIHLFSSWLA